MYELDVWAPIAAALLVITILLVTIVMIQKQKSKGTSCKFLL